MSAKSEPQRSLMRSFRIRTRLTIGICTTIVVLLVANWIWYSRPQQRFGRALAALERRDFQYVEVEITRLKLQPGGTKYADILTGAVLLRRNRYQEAIRYFSRTPPEQELRPVVLLWTGECLYRLGRLVEAEWALRQLVDEHPQDDSAHRWLGTIYHDLGVMDAAIVELQRALELNPADLRPHFLLALIYFDVEQYAPAVFHYRQVMAQGPNPNASLNLAMSLIRLQKHDEALEVLRSRPVDVDGLILQAVCHGETGDQDRAKHLLREAQGIDPTSLAVLVCSSQMLLDAHKPEEAVPVLKQVLSRNPQDFRTRYQLAMAYRDVGLLDEYKAEMDRYEESRKLNDRYMELTRQARKQPSDAQIREELSMVADQLGKPEIAALWKRGAAAFRQLPANAQ